MKLMLDSLAERFHENRADIRFLGIVRVLTTAKLSSDALCYLIENPYVSP